MPDTVIFGSWLWDLGQLNIVSQLNTSDGPPTSVKAYLVEWEQHLTTFLNYVKVRACIQPTLYNTVCKICT